MLRDSSEPSVRVAPMVSLQISQMCIVFSASSDGEGGEDAMRRSWFCLDSEMAFENGGEKRMRRWYLR